MRRWKNNLFFLILSFCFQYLRFTILQKCTLYLWNERKVIQMGERTENLLLNIFPKMFLVHFFMSFFFFIFHTYNIWFNKMKCMKIHFLMLLYCCCCCWSDWELFPEKNRAFKNIFCINMYEYGWKQKMRTREYGQMAWVLWKICVRYGNFLNSY